MNVRILFNEDSGRSLTEAHLRELVERCGHTIVDVVSAPDAEARPPLEGIDLVVAAGGDGTVETASRLVAKTPTPLAILPLGTANNIATSLGIAADVPTLISSWHTARRVRLDLGYARAGSREWVVVEGLGGGLIPAGIAAAERALEAAKAHPTVAVATAVDLFYEVMKEIEPARRTITIDGVRISEDLLMFEVLNIRSVGPNLVLAPDATPFDGLFDVILAGPRHRADLLEYLDARRHNVDRRLSLPCRHARNVRIDSGEELHIDDARVDTSGLAGIDISIEPGAVTLLM